jgi:hypothetical protein
MARFFERRDNQYISDYAPLPLGLMQKAADDRQKERKDVEAKTAGINPYTGKVIEKTRHDGQYTQDYKDVVAWNSQVAQKVADFSSELQNSDDLKGIARKLDEFRLEKFKKESQGGDLFRMTENEKERSEFEKKVFESDMLPETKEAMLRERDLAYERQGYYKSGEYGADPLIKYSDITKGINDYLSTLPADYDVAVGGYDPNKIPGFIESWKKSDKIRTNAKLFHAGLNYLSEDGIINSNLQRQMQNKAQNTAQAERQKAISEGKSIDEANGLYDRTYENVMKREYSAFDEANFKVDENGNMQTLDNTIVNQYVARGARDYKYHEKETDEGVTPMPGIDFGTGGTPKTDPLRLHTFDVKSKDMSFGKLREEVVNLGNAVSDYDKKIAEAVANGEDAAVIDNDNNGPWMISGSGSGRGWIAVSRDNGSTWGICFVTSTLIRQVSYNNGVWVAVGDLGTLFRSYDDGLTWVSNEVGFANNARTVALNGSNGVWVVAGSNGAMSRATPSTTEFLVKKDYVKNGVMHIYTGETA